MNIGLATWNPLLKLAALTAWLPTPMLLGYWGMMSSRALIAGVELGVFDLLAEEPGSAKDIAASLGTDPTGTEALLNALNGFGFLRRSRGVYRNGRAVRRWIAQGARFRLDGAFGLFHVLWDELDDIEGRLTSPGARDFHGNRDADFWSRYENGLAQFARLAAGEIVRKVPTAGHPARLLDVGGGHATYSARFCRQYPGLAATVLDLPGAASVGQQLVDAADLTDRFTFTEGDLVATDWESGYDIVLMFNIIHIFTPEEVAGLFAKAHAALKPAGTLAVLDSAHRGGTGDIDAAGGANELLFWTINNTRAYPEESVSLWMHDAGFRDIRTRHLMTVPQAALTVARA